MFSKNYYGELSVSYARWPSLDFLRFNRGVRWCNTGRQYQVGSSGIVTDDYEGLHAITDEAGRVIFRSGTEFPMVSYRGQLRDYSSCLPTLARLKHPEEQLLALTRCIAFEDAIGDHPYVRICDTASFLNAPFFVDREGLAQHYGLSTNLLDVTNSFEVASFFASCAWQDGRGFQPVQSAEFMGVIYQVQPYLLMLTDEMVEYCDVGWQPLHRPEQQRAAAFRLMKGVAFEALPTVKKHYFVHSARASKKIWKMFDGGKVLFPDDAPAELANRAMKLMTFTRDQINRAWERYDGWHSAVSSSDMRIKIESAAEIVEGEPELSWDELNLERDETRLREGLIEVMSRVQYRLAADHRQE